MIKLGNFIWNKWIAKIEKEPLTPLVLYKEEFAAAAEAKDFLVNAGDKEEDYDVKFAEEVFPQVAHIITTLGFMDEMRNFIVQYD